MVTNLINVVSTFCGCGGSSLGYKRANCKVILATDAEPKALETYKLNFPGTSLLQEDIRKLTKQKIREIIGDIDIDVLDGSPPCTPFSMCGVREKKWNIEYKSNNLNLIQRHDDLFFEYVRLIKELNPKIFIAENVKGLILGKAKGYFNEILRQMRQLGYHVEPHILNAKYYDVPQSRERIIFIGYRKDIKINENVFLHRHKITTVNEALKFIESNDDEIKKTTDSFMNSRDYKIFLHMKQGESCFDYLGKRFGMIRLKGNDASNTIHTRANMLIHPTKNRFITLSEAKALHSFPQDFKFLTYNDGMKRLGNSVPPNLIKNIMLYVKEKTGLK